MDERISCPCCYGLTLEEQGAYEICETCGWEDDPVQFADPDYRGGANKLSLNEARSLFHRPDLNTEAPAS